MSYRLINANDLNGVISNDDYEKVLNAPCIFVDLPNGLDGGHYNLQESVLEKIRAEIDAESAKSFGYPNWERAKALEWVLSVIDKYKAESGRKAVVAWMELPKAYEGE